jgi:cyclophilin family peptidyl-prolyl cis-trans isomerase/HEAT repeat protein
VSCLRAFALSGLIAVSAQPSFAQTSLAVLEAEDRRAPTASDLAIIRGGARSRDPQVARIGVRALGRLERPALIPDILPSLRNAVPDVRAEAANAIGQAAQGWKKEKPSLQGLDSALAALAARLRVEAEPDVRAAIAETIGRLPYQSPQQVEKAEQVLVDLDGHNESITDRLGVAKGMEALVRMSRKVREPGAEALATMKRYVEVGGAEATTGARVRRLALEALVTASATDDALMATAVADKDAQVRRIAMRAAPINKIVAALDDESPIVRLAALTQLKSRSADDMCAASVRAAADHQPHVALVALDQLSACGESADALETLDRAVTDLTDAADPRGWHRAAHALVALAAAAPDRAEAVIGQFTGSRIWQLRMYAGRAAAQLKSREILEKLASDDDDNVREAAIEGLYNLVGHAADPIYVAQLSRRGNQVLRAAATALAEAPNPDEVVPALRAALERLVAKGSDNSHDARDAITKTLTSLGEKTTAGHNGAKGAGASSTHGTTVNDLSADDLRRLAAPRARITMRGIGAFELALFTSQASATVLRFVKLAESGYYNGLTFHRVVPNFVIQGGSPGANEYVGDARFMRDELGLWPHVRGAVGISTRGRDTGDAQIFIDLVDNPRLDHEYTVFAQVLNGIDVVDRILEGDVIERIEIITAP